EEMDKTVKEDTDRASRARPYFELRHKLQEMQRFSQVLNDKVADERIEIEIPRKPAVEVLDTAATPRRPVYPNRSQAVALIVLGLLLDFAALAILNSARRPPTLRAA